MYRCDLCKQLIPPNTPSLRIPAEFRPVQYPFRADANRFYRKRKLETTDDPGGTGSEIVRELVVCPSCALK
jgi:hypothetical protein